MYFWTYGLRKTCLDKCLKSPLSEDPSRSNMVNRSKHCSNLNDSTFTIFIDPSEGNSGLKSISERYAKSQNSLLTHSLLTISFLFLTEAIYCSIFKCNYLRNEKLFLNFFFPFSKFRFNFEHFQKKDDNPSCCIFELTSSEIRG